MAFDWIERYVELTSELRSPEIFRRWSAITTIGAVLERRVWSIGVGGKIYPNIFTLLVGPPASGKNEAIKPLRDLVISLGESFRLAPDNVTRPSLIKHLMTAAKIIPNSKGEFYSPLFVSVPEFGVFFSTYDFSFLSNINYLFDCPDVYDEERVTDDGKNNRHVERPSLVILAGTQPDALASFLPEQAWGMGFTSRLIMVYAPRPEPGNILGSRTQDYTSLRLPLRNIYNLNGPCTWTDDAFEALNQWNRDSCPPVPTHHRLQHYNGRRSLYVIKLAMISAASERCERIITLSDYERAKKWLLDIETKIPDIFKAMNQQGDNQIILDLHHHCYRIWAALPPEKRHPIPRKTLSQFLYRLVPSERINRIIDTSVDAGVFKRGKYPDEFIPQLITEVFDFE